VTYLKMKSIYTRLKHMWGVEVQLQPFLTLSLGGVIGQIDTPGALPLGENHGTRGWFASGADLGRFVEGNLPMPLPGFESHIVQPVVAVTRSKLHVTKHKMTLIILELPSHDG
jgi:hypothetical protein